MRYTLTALLPSSQKFGSTKLKMHFSLSHHQYDLLYVQTQTDDTVSDAVSNGIKGVEKFVIVINLDFLRLIFDVSELLTKKSVASQTTFRFL